MAISNKFGFYKSIVALNIICENTRSGMSEVGKQVGRTPPRFWPRSYFSPHYKLLSPIFRPYAIPEQCFYFEPNLLFH